MRSYERYDTVVDKKWRFPFPIAIAKKFARQSEVTIALTRTGCLGIYASRRDFDGTRVPLRRSRNHKYVRAIIPQELRGAMSFFFGNTITAVCKKGFVELQPRPPWSGKNGRIK